NAGADSQIDLLANEIGEFICYWGFKRIHGRIWTHIYLSRVPLDAAALRKKLRVSKALMSLSLNDLLAYEVILESGKSLRGTQTYVANPQILDIILNVLRAREKKLINKIEEQYKAISSLKADSIGAEGVNPNRIESLGEMIQLAQHTLDSM